jgi:hypothetical protein
MMKFNLMVAAAATALALGATAAQAGTGVYTLSGEWNGSFNGVAFRGTGFTFTMTGDTSLVGDVNPANFVDPDVQFLNTLESTTVKLDGFGTFTLLDGTHLAARIAGGEAVFDQYEPNDRNLFIWDNTAPVDLTKSFGPIVSSLSEVISDIIPTTGGDLQFDGGGRGTHPHLLGRRHRRRAGTGELGLDAERLLRPWGAAAPSARDSGPRLGPQAGAAPIPT